MIPHAVGAPKFMQHNYWARALEPTSLNHWGPCARAPALQQKKTLQQLAHTLQLEGSPARCS